MARLTPTWHVIQRPARSLDAIDLTEVIRDQGETIGDLDDADVVLVAGSEERPKTSAKTVLHYDPDNDLAHNINFAALRRFDIIASDSRATAKKLIDCGIDRTIAAVGIGIDYWVNVAEDVHYVAPGRNFRFLHVSNAESISELNYLIDAFSSAFGADDDVSLIVISASLSYKCIRNEISYRRQFNMNMPDIILVEPDLDQRQIKALYAQCHVFVSPMSQSGFQLPLAQSMVSGMPAVVVCIGGHMDYCSERCCWLVDYSFTAMGVVGSVGVEPIHSSFVRALQSAQRTPKMMRNAMANRGRATLIDRFSWASVAGRLTATAEPPIDAVDLETYTDIQIGWITTWNIRCGIATFSSHLSRSIAQNSFIFAAQDAARTGRDGPNVSRSWIVDKECNGLNSILDELEERNINCLIIQFNFGFYNHEELNDFIAQVATRGLVIFFHLHSTIEPFGNVKNFSLSDLLPSLKLSHRIIVHSAGDMNRLKRHGLIQNVLLMPHGVVKLLEIDRPERVSDSVPLLVSFGFAFLSKGLIELIEALGILHRRGRRVRLRMLNAEYPTEESKKVLQSVRARISQLRLDDYVDLRTEFLEDDVCLQLIAEADLVVNPYQRTGESASGATRYGLTARRPVAVTPLPFFDDLGDAVYRFPGTSPSEIADGIEMTLDHLEKQTDEARKVSTSAQQWLDDHDYEKQGRQILRIVRSLVINNARD